MIDKKKLLDDTYWEWNGTVVYNIEDADDEIEFILDNRERVLEILNTFKDSAEVWKVRFGEYDD